MLVYELKDRLRPIIADIQKQTPQLPGDILVCIMLASSSVLYEKMDPTAEIQDEMMI